MAKQAFSDVTPALMTEFGWDWQRGSAGTEIGINIQGHLGNQGYGEIVNAVFEVDRGQKLMGHGDFIVERKQGQGA
jgi:hypothetical protein